MTDRGPILRSLLVACVLLIVLAVIGSELGKLHLGPNDKLWELVTSKQNVEKEFLFGRKVDFQDR